MGGILPFSSLVATLKQKTPEGSGNETSGADLCGELPEVGSDALVRVVKGTARARGVGRQGEGGDGCVGVYEAKPPRTQAHTNTHPRAHAEHARTHTRAPPPPSPPLPSKQCEHVEVDGGRGVLVLEQKLEAGFHRAAGLPPPPPLRGGGYSERL